MARAAPQLAVLSSPASLFFSGLANLADPDVATQVPRRYATYEDFIHRANPSLWRFEHVRWLAPVVDQLVAGTIINLMVLAPPRYLKSECFGRLLVPYFLDAHPQAHIGIISHSDHLALNELSDPARARYRDFVGDLNPATEAKGRWETLLGGVVWAAGVGGHFQGQGLDLGVLDDPVDVEQSRSFAHQQRFVRFWPQRYLNRREPGARTVLVMQRLGPDDPVDYLLRREVGEHTEQAPMHWHVLILDEVKSDEPLGRWDGPRGLPKTCTLVDVDPRKPGELLAPSRFSSAAVEGMRRETAPYTVATQRQQRPLVPSGDFWREKWFTTYDVLPPTAHNGGWDHDTAFTDNERNSAWAAVQSFRGPGPEGEFPIYVNDLQVDWLEFPALIARIQALTGPHYIEAKASGKSAKQTLRASGIQAEEIPVKGDKLARASAVQPTVANGRVLVRKAILEKLLWMERQGLLRITAEALAQDGQGLDLNDAFVQALFRHIGIGLDRYRVVMPASWRR